MTQKDAAAGSAHGTEVPLLHSSAAGTPRRNRFAFVCATLASMTNILHSYSTYVIHIYLWIFPCVFDFRLCTCPSMTDDDDHRPWRWAVLALWLLKLDLTLMSGAQLFIREDVGLSDTEIEVLAGSMNVFMLASILVSGWVADRLGRRSTLVLANAFLMAGALAMSLGSSYPTLLAARFVTGIGAGFSRVVAAVYNAEISPPSSRGFLSSMLNIFINVGTLLSYVSNYAFAGLPLHLGWRVMYAVGVVPPVFIAAGVLFMPESPRWLAMAGRQNEAHAVLLRTSDTPAEADLRFGEIKRAVAEAQEAGGSHGGVWKELLFRPSSSSSSSLRRILAYVLGLQFFVPASGVEVILLYSPLVFKQVGLASNTAILGATLAMGVVKTGFVLVGMLLTDRLGRRPLLLASTAGVAVTTACLAATLTVGGAAASAAAMAACFALVLAVVATYSFGYASVVNTYSAEILPLRLRAQGMGMGLAVNRLISAAVTMTFISLANGITMPGCFLLYAALTAAAFVFVYARLPETKGRSLEDMDVLFDK